MKSDRGFNSQCVDLEQSVPRVEEHMQPKLLQYTDDFTLLHTAAEEGHILEVLILLRSNVLFHRTLLYFYLSLVVCVLSCCLYSELRSRIATLFARVGCSSAPSRCLC
jgi:hypothetical protein